MTKPAVRQLKPHQQRGRDWLLGGAGRALLWRMGGGKTGAALAALADNRKRYPTSACWVVAPRLVADTTWATEPALWPGFAITPRRVTGGPAQRRRILLEHPDDVLLLHYEQLGWAAGEVKGGRIPAPRVIVFDEASALRNPLTLRWRAAIFLAARAEHRWLLTGSPFGTAGLVNAWGLVSVMDLGATWGSGFTLWRDQHFSSDAKGWRWWPKPDTEVMVERVLRGFGHALRDEDYAAISTDLVREWVTLPERARQRYDDAASDLRDQLRDIIELSAAQPILGVLQQLASGAIYDAPGSPNWVRVHDAKLDRLGELLGEAGPSLVYCQYKHEVARLRRRWPCAPVLTGGVAQTDLVRAVDQWNAGEHELMIMHPAVAAYGLNLQQGGASAIWFSLPWSVEHFQQGNARLARPGQAKRVVITLLLAAGTIDVVMDRALQNRGRLERDLLTRLAA